MSKHIKTHQKGSRLNIATSSTDVNLDDLIMGTEADQSELHQNGNMGMSIGLEDDDEDDDDSDDESGSEEISDSEIAPTSHNAIQIPTSNNVRM